MLMPFHLAFPVNDLKATEAFYVDVLGCKVGRKSGTWIDFDFFGHQITAHLRASVEKATVSQVDADQVPVPHFGIVLTMDDWQGLASRIAAVGAECFIGPKIRFQGEVGEQGTLFIRDPSGNALEFKGFNQLDQVFAH